MINTRAFLLEGPPHAHQIENFELPQNEKEF